MIYNCQDMEATYASINRWMDKEDVLTLQRNPLQSSFSGMVLKLGFLATKGSLQSQNNENKRAKRPTTGKMWTGERRDHRQQDTALLLKQAQEAPQCS